jgi:hypothetical protein
MGWRTRLRTLGTVTEHSICVRVGAGLLQRCPKGRMPAPAGRANWRENADLGAEREGSILAQW